MFVSRLCLVITALSSVATAGAQVADSSKWTLTESTNKMDDSKTASLSLRAIASISVWSNRVTPQLILRCRDGHGEAYVTTGTPAHPEFGRFGSYSIRYRLDGQPAVAETWAASTDDLALFAPFPGPLVSSLLTTKRLLFEFTPFNSSPVIIEFHPDGLAAAIAPLTSACGWTLSADSAILAVRSPIASTQPRSAPPDSIEALPGWIVGPAICLPAGDQQRCTIAVRNATIAKSGFRLENVLPSSTQPLTLAKARAFVYTPRSSFGMEDTQGNCDAGATCQVELTIDVHAESLSFSVSTWGASFGGAKQRESLRVSLPVRRR